MKRVKGNLIKMAKNGEFNAIIHGCNCFNRMGSGIASDIKREFNKAYSVDFATKKGDYNKLGNYTRANVDAVLVINAYTQYNISVGEDVFEYASFEVILKKLVHFYADQKLNWGIPYIGMGLARGDQTRIIPMIEKFAQQIEDAGGTVSLVEFNG